MLSVEHQWQVVMITTGAVLAGWFHHLAAIPNLARYTYGDRGIPPGVKDAPPAAWVAELQKALPDALTADLWFILGYGLLLGGFAWILRRQAVSVFSRAASAYVVAAVAITVIADLIETALLALTLHYGNVTLTTATAAAATVKWCAALLALAGVPAVVSIWGRAGMARFRMARLKAKGMSDAVVDKWWDHVLADPELPTVISTDPPAAEVNEAEWSWIDAYNVPGARQVIEDRDGNPVQAMCLSGGGVRSACVAMGAMQVFSDADPIPPVPAALDPSGDRIRLIDAVDYVISVSGGGYSAGARLLAVQPTGAAPDLPHVSQRFEEGSVEFDHFRRGSSYIADSPAGLIWALAMVFKNLVASLLTLFIVPVIAGWVIGYLLAHPSFAFAAFVPVPNPLITEEFKAMHPELLLALVNHPAAWWAAALFAFFSVVFTMVAIIAEWRKSGPDSDRRRQFALRLSRASALFAVLIVTVTAGVPGLMRLCANLGTIDASAGVTAAAISGVVGLNYLSAIVAMVRNRAKLPVGEMAKPSWWKSILPPGVWQMLLVVVTLAVLLVVWLVVLGSFAAGVFHQVTLDGIHLNSIPNWEWWLFGLGATALLFGFADVTSLSLHPFYRLRLAKTFAVRRAHVGPPPSPGQPAGGPWRAAAYTEDEWTWLHEFGRVHPGGPRFVFAAAAALTGRAKPAPGLTAVSYVLSGEHIGGPELGWFKTAELFDACPPRLRRDLTVEASIAISGAAFASAMGRQNKGFQKLLAVSGARLGSWLPNPSFAGKLKCAADKSCVDPADITKPWPKALPTIRGASYFYRELFGINYNDARLVQVTDGGHYENLGLVEALRRRARLIFCVDGGGDAPPLTGGLADAMRLAEYELGVTITLDTDGPYSVANIAPGSGTAFGEGHALASLNKRLTKGMVVAGRITYPAAAGLDEDQSEGVLIFAKAVVWEGCPYWLLTYAAAQTLFPHDPTSDQWFNEGQFAAYTALGRLMAEQAVQCAASLAADGVLDVA